MKTGKIYITGFILFHNQTNIENLSYNMIKTEEELRLQNINKKFDHFWRPMLEILYEYKGKIKTIYVKCEHYNLTGSIKDRMALYINLADNNFSVFYRLKLSPVPGLLGI